MRVVVLLPGIMGSRLSLAGREIWPPTLAEATFGYNRLGNLLDPNAVPTDVIRQVTACYPVYASLIDRLRRWGIEETSAGGSAGRLICWPYDWRLDIRDIAYALSKQLNSLVGTAGTNTELVLMGHSMGGLVCRYALEVDDAKLGPVGWRDRCSLFTSFGTPHRGAPQALIHALGIEGTLGISAADVKTLAADSRYRAAYQLLPPGNAFAFWARYNLGAPLTSIDVLDAAFAAPLGLNAANVQAATDFHTSLAAGSRPRRCRYVTFIGRRIETIVRGDFTGPQGVVPSKVQDGGDGTVPVWSGTLPDTQFQLDGDEHGRTFRDPELLKTLGALLGVSPALMATTPTPPIRVRLSKPVFHSGQTMRVSIEVVGGSVAGLLLAIYPIAENGTPGPVAFSKVVAAPDIESQAAIVEANVPSAPGLYGARAQSTDGNAVSEQEAFAVQS